MSTIDLKGWWCVSDDGDDTVARECIGTVLCGDKGFAAMLRNPATGECDLSNYLTSYSWFAERAQAEAHAAKIVAAYDADDEGEGEDGDDIEEAA